MAGSNKFDPIRFSDVLSQLIAVGKAVHGVGGVIDIHVVNDTSHSVAKGQGLLDGAAVTGIVHIAKVNGKVIGTIVTAAGGRQARGRGVIDGQLVLVGAIGCKIGRIIIGDGVAAAPILMIAPLVSEGVLQIGIALVVPVICGGCIGGIQQRSAVLSAVNQRGPVGTIGIVGTALIVRVFESQDFQFIILTFRFCSKCGHRQHSQHHDKNKEQGKHAFFHKK